MDAEDTNSIIVIIVVVVIIVNISYKCVLMLLFVLAVLEEKFVVRF